MAKIIVYKKVLHCISLANWQWGTAIVEAECEESDLLSFPYAGEKCRVPEVTVKSIHPTYITNERARLAAVREGDLAGAVDTNSFSECDSFSYTWYTRHNFTNVKDGDFVSWYDHTKWVVGETVKCDWWESLVFGQCAHGIHVFKTREKAENYQFPNA